MSAQRLRSVVSRSGQPNVEVDGNPYHSPNNPLREAQQFYSSYPIEKADVILHYGWGLGYCGEVLRDRMRTSARVIVFEPDEELFRFSLSLLDNPVVLQDDRFRFVIGRGVCQFLDDWTREECQKTGKFLWLVWPAAQTSHPALAASLTKNVQRIGQSGSSAHTATILCSNFDNKRFRAS